MKTISLIKDFGLNDASNEDKIMELLDKVIIENENDIELDLLHCIIDYPATAMLIDKILFQLAKLNDDKKLLVKVSYSLPEQTLLNNILGDSKFFDIKAKREIPIEELKQIINKQLASFNMALEIVLLDRSNKVLKQYKYGR